MPKVAVPFPGGYQSPEDMWGTMYTGDPTGNVRKALRAKRAPRKGVTIGRIVMWGVYAALITTIFNLIMWLSYAEWQYLNLPH